MAGSTKNDIAHHFAARGNALCDSIDATGATGAMYPTPSGPTRPRRELVAGKWVHLDSGTVNDHFVIGHDVLGCILRADMESETLPGAWPSDHLPLIWSAVIGGIGKRDRARTCAGTRRYAAVQPPAPRPRLARRDCLRGLRDAQLKWSFPGFCPGRLVVQKFRSCELEGFCTNKVQKL